ncbi:MAG: hypothetical protein L0Y39_12460, partial [Methylococcaceae bacterium]|nr:hypothetical protein [Methylococcaceae bacterium]
TNGPEAEVGEILNVHFTRPRDRKEIMEHPDYYRLREHLITFLEERAYKKSEFSSETQPPAPAGEKIVKLAARSKEHADKLLPRHIECVSKRAPGALRRT